MIAVLCVRDRGSDPFPVVKFGSTWHSDNRHSVTSFLFHLKECKDMASYDERFSLKQCR